MITSPITRCRRGSDIGRELDNLLGSVLGRWQGWAGLDWALDREIKWRLVHHRVAIFLPGKAGWNNQAGKGNKDRDRVVSLDTTNCHSAVVQVGQITALWYEGGRNYYGQKARTRYKWTRGL